MKFKFLKISKKWLIPALGLVAIIVVFGFSTDGKAFFKRMSVYFENVSNPNLSSSPRNFWLPSGKETYQIVQAEGADPKIHEATIDPPDVHVGDMQKLSIVVSSEYDIESVVAKIETDNGIVELPLKFVKKVSNSELQPLKYAVNEKSELVAFENSDIENSLKIAKLKIVNSASAHAEEDWDKLLYEESWKVRDTHNTKYHTTFVVKNVKAQENSITLAWSDACAIPRSGNWNLATSYGANCTISSPDGIEIGTSTIQTYTLTLNSKFAFNPGYGIVISSGAIAIGTGGEIRQSYVWEPDGDGDGYGRGADYVVQDTQPSASQRRSAFSDPADCNDWNVGFFIFQEAYRDADKDRYFIGGGVNVCTDGNAEYDGFAQWVYDESVTAHIKDGSGPNGSYILGGSDADDNNGSVH